MAVTAADYSAIGGMIDSITSQYPAFAPLLQIPEIAKILIDASEPGAQWTPQKVQAAIQGTNWWKTTSAPARSWQVTKLVDPATAAQTSAQTAVQIHQMAAQEGIILKPQDLATLTDQAQANAWNAAQIQQAVGSQAHAGQLRAGTMQQTAMGLRSTASDYGVPLSGKTAFDWSQKIAEGTATTDGFTAWAKNQAATLYPTLKEHLDQGMTVRQLFDPYAQIASQTLGIDPNAIELTSPKWIAALQGKDPQGKTVGPMSQQDWQSKLMTDPTYGYDKTENARASATNLVQQLGQAFGVIKQ